MINNELHFITLDGDERNTIVNAIYELHDKVGTECIMFREKEADDIDYVTIIKAKDNRLAAILTKSWRKEF